MKILDKLFDRDLHGNAEEKLDGAKKQRNLFFILLVVIFILALFCAGTLTYVNSDHYKQIDTYDKQIDTYFIEQYYGQYEPVGKERIDKIILEVNSIPDSQDKLNAIADWVIDDFVNFRQYEKWNPSYPYTKTLGSNYRYDYSGRIRAEHGMYHQNPNWIAYHKMGACGELSSLFSYVANQTGFETRLVCAKYADGSNNHQWVEVNVDGVWMYYDPTIYWDNNYLNKNDEWHGTFDEKILWNTTVSGIIDQTSGKDICSEHYPNIKQVTGLDSVLYYIFHHDWF